MNPDPFHRLEEVRSAMAEMGRLLEDVDWGLLDRCDCGHRRLEHADVDGDRAAHGGYADCQRNGCPCECFDDSGQQAERWRRDRAARERKVADLAAKRAEREGDAA